MAIDVEAPEESGERLSSSSAASSSPSKRSELPESLPGGRSNARATADLAGPASSPVSWLHGARGSGSELSLHDPTRHAWHLQRVEDQAAPR